MKLLPVQCTLSFVNNVLSVFVPQLWAQESLMILENTMVLGNLVHRNFENIIADFGDTVNTRRPAKFVANRKDNDDNVTIQDAVATNVAVKLDQHWHTSFIIKDREQSLSFKDLVATYLAPAVLAIAEQIDAVLSTQVYQFLGNSVGQLGGVASLTTVVDVKAKLNQLLCPVSGRNCVLPPLLEASLLKDISFNNADRVGDDGTALREGNLGRKFGLDFYMGQQMPSITAATTTVIGAINAGLLIAGTTTITVNGFAAAIINGSWFTVGGVPYKVVSTVGGAAPTSITIAAPGLRDLIVNAAVVTVYTPAAINFAAGYAANYVKNLTINGAVIAPKMGQMITTPAGDIYATIQPNTVTNIPYLDRPLVAGLVDTTVLGLGPIGNYGLAFHKNAITLVTRPLATPIEGLGALSYVASYRGLSVRVTITYNGDKQGTLVTVDVLGGIKVLDTNLAVAILG